MIHALIISDVRLFRDALARALVEDGRLGVSDVVGGVADATRLNPSPAPAPDVILLDVTLPEGLAAVDTMHRRFPGAKVLALGVGNDAQHIVACAEAGVAGFVCREDSLEDLVRSAQNAMLGELRCSGRVAAALLERVAALAVGAPADGGGCVLTPRELEVMRLVEDGLSNKEIAARLDIEVATAKNHVHNILEKLGVHRRGEAVAKLRRSGALSPTRGRPEKAFLDERQPPLQDSDSVVAE